MQAARAGTPLAELLHGIMLAVRLAIDSEGIRTPAGRAQWISSPPPLATRSRCHCKRDAVRNPSHVNGGGGAQTASSSPQHGATSTDYVSRAPGVVQWRSCGAGAAVVHA